MAKAKNKETTKTEKPDDVDPVKGNTAAEPTGDQIAKETMTGDLRDIILDVVRTQMKPWQQLTEDEQRSLADDINSRCEHIVAKAVKTISADGRKVVAGQLEQVTIKDGIKLVVKVSKHDEQRHEVYESQGKAVLMVVSDAAEYTGERAPADIDLTQPGLPGTDEDDTPVADNGKATARAA